MKLFKGFLPNDVEKLKEMYLEKLAEIERLEEDNKYLNEVVLGEVPIRHRRTMLKKMNKLDRMTEEEFNKLRPGVEVGEIRFMYFPNYKHQGENFRFPHPFYVIYKYGHLLTDCPISKQPNSTEETISVQLEGYDYDRSFLLLSRLTTIDERRDVTSGAEPLKFNLRTEKEYVDYKINQFHAGYSHYKQVNKLSEIFTY